jgi:EmrB/QacA subfamily drug resistance transporter
MGTVEVAVVTAVLPSVTQELGGLHLYRWIVAAYMLANAMLMPVFGRLADSYGRRPSFFTALFLFLAGSAASGAAPSMQVLIAFRVVQGLGAGGLMVLAYTILGDIYSPAERARVQGWLAALWSAAGAAGPILGVMILRVASWRWAFYVNIPIGLFVWIMVRQLYVDTHVPRRRGFDVIGSLLLSAAIALLLLSIGQHLSYVGLITSALLFAAFIFQERRATEPVLPLALLRNPSVSLACFTDFARIGAAYGAMTYLPLFASSRAGGNAANAGLVLLPIFIGVFAGSVVGGHIAHHISLRTFARVALWLYTGAAVAYAWYVVCGGSVVVSRATLVLLGMGLSGGSLALVLIVQVSVPRSELGTATGALTLSRNLGGAVGVGLLGALLASEAPVDEFTAAAGQALLVPLRHIFIAIPCIALIGAITTLRFPPSPKLSAVREIPETAEDASI